MSMLSTGLSGLTASQQSMQVLSQNISNAGTTGYSRQDVISSPVPLQAQGGTIYGGVSVDSVRNTRNELLDQNILSANSSLGKAQTNESWYAHTEALFSPLDEQNIMTQIGACEEAFNAIQLNPDQPGINTVAVEELAGLVDYYNQIGNDLNDLSASAATTLNQYINECNTLLNNIAELNQAINISSGSGGIANELIDQRSVALEELSLLMDFDTIEMNNNMISVSSGGTLLVGMDGAISMNSLDFNGNGYAISIAGSSANFTPEDGAISGMLTMINETIPSMQNDIDTMAYSSMRTLNLAQASGIANDGNQPNHAASHGFSADQIHIDLDQAVATSERGLGVNPAFTPSFPTQTSATAMTLRIYDDQTQTETEFVVTYDPNASPDNSRSITNLTNAINTGSDGGFTINPPPDGSFNASMTTTAQGEMFSVSSTGSHQLTFGIDTQLEQDLILGLGIDALVTGTGAHNMAIDNDIYNDPDLLGINSGWSGHDGVHAAMMSDLDADNQLSDMFSNTVAAIGTAQQRSQVQIESQQSLLSSLENQRQVEMGVDVDQQMTLMLEQQQIYEAASQLITIARENMAALFDMLG